MSSQSVELPTEHVEAWKARLSKYESVSLLMRDLAKEYGAPRNDVGAMLYLLFDNFSLDEVSYVWKWDFANTGIGLPDARIDTLLGHLLSGKGAQPATNSIATKE